MKKILFLMIIPIIILFLVSQIDDDLDPRATQLINKTEVVTQSEAYIFLNGIFAHENENPSDVGQALLNESNKLAEDESYQIVDYSEDKKIQLPESDLFCSMSEESCLHTIFNAEQATIEHLSQQHATLLSRAQKFHEFSEYKTLTKPTLSELSPPFEYLKKAEYINILNAISVYKQGHSQQAVSLLLTQFSILRKSLKQQDSLIGKMFLLITMSDIVDAASIIISKEKIDVDVIPELTLAEKSFEMVAAREFAMGYYLFKQLDKSPELFEIGGDIPEWYVRMIYKPNMTINATIPFYLRVERLATLTPTQFIKEIKQQTPPTTSKIRNYVGNVLLNIASPNFDEYIARFIDLDAKLTMFNQLHHFKYDVNDIKNPYDELKTPNVLDNMMCFDGAFEDEHLIRCLRTKL